MTFQAPPPPPAGAAAQAVQLVKPSTPAATPATPATESPDLKDHPGAEHDSHAWFGNAATTAGREPGTKPATQSEIREFRKELRETLDGLAGEGVELASRGVHLALASHDPAQVNARVWIATDEQAADIADPAVELLVGHVPEALLQKTVVHALRLAMALARYVTDHLALREQVSPRRLRGRGIPVPAPEVQAS